MIGRLPIDSQFGPNVNFAIIGGDPDGAFELNVGISREIEIIVANGSLIDFETTPVYTLILEADDARLPTVITTTITINVNDLVERQTPTSFHEIRLRANGCRTRQTATASPEVSLAAGRQAWLGPTSWKATSTTMALRTSLLRIRTTIGGSSAVFLNLA